MAWLAGSAVCGSAGGFRETGRCAPRPWGWHARPWPAGWLISKRMTSGTVSGIVPGLAGAAGRGLVGGGAWVLVRSHSNAAVTAQIANAAVTSTVGRVIA